jgi:hypothetical protein
MPGICCRIASVANDPKPTSPPLGQFVCADHRASFCMNVMIASAIKSGRSRIMK